MRKRADKITATNFTTPKMAVANDFSVWSFGSTEGEEVGHVDGDVLSTGPTQQKMSDTKAREIVGHKK